MLRVREQVVERSAAGADLKPVDAAETAVVGDDQRHRPAHHHRCRQFRVQHQIGSVTRKHDVRAVGRRHIHTDTGRHLVTHAGKPVFHVIAVNASDLPQLVKLSRHRACRSDNDRLRRAGTVDGADHLTVGRQRIAVCRRVTDIGNLLDPPVPGTGDFGTIAITRRICTHGLRERLNAAKGIAHERHGVMFHQIMRLNIQGDDLALDERIRSGGEVLQPASDRQHDIGLFGKAVGRRCAGHAKRADIELVTLDHRRFACLRGGDGDAGSFGEIGQRLRRTRIADAAAADDERTPRRQQRRNGAIQFTFVRPDTADGPQARREETLRIVPCLGLDILAQAQRHRPAISRVGQHRHRLRQGLKKLFRTGDAIKIA